MQKLYYFLKVASQRVRCKGFRAVDGDIDVSGRKIEDFEKQEVALPLMSGSVQLPDNEGWFVCVVKIVRAFRLLAYLNLPFRFRFRVVEDLQRDQREIPFSLLFRLRS